MSCDWATSVREAVAARALFPVPEEGGGGGEGSLINLRNLHPFDAPSVGNTEVYLFASRVKDKNTFAESPPLEITVYSHMTAATSGPRVRWFCVT